MGHHGDGGGRVITGNSSGSTAGPTIGLPEPTRREARHEYLHRGFDQLVDICICDPRPYRDRPDRPRLGEAEVVQSGPLAHTQTSRYAAREEDFSAVDGVQEVPVGVGNRRSPRRSEEATFDICRNVIVMST